MSDSPRLLIHVGYPKSGSSTLQQAVLARHSGINYLSGASLTNLLGPSAREAFNFYKAMTGEIQQEISTTRAIWEQYYLSNADARRLNVLSTEYFVQNKRPVEDVAADLREVVGEAHILMVVREQADLLRSLYDMNPFFENDPSRAYMDFGPWLDRMLEEAETTFASRMSYASVAAVFAEAFGAPNLHVISFDRLFRCVQMLEPFCRAMRIDFDEFASLVAGHHIGHSADHSYKKLTRRVLGGRSIVAYAPAPVLSAAKSALRRLVPAKKTVVGNEDMRKIHAFYANNRVSDLAALPIGTVIV